MKSLIIGGTQFIGRHLVAGLQKAGHEVTGCDANVYPPMSTQLEALGIEAVGDMAKAEEATGCVEQTAKHFGGVDVLVHSAGGPVNGGLFAITPETWHTAFSVHVHAIFHLCRAAIPFMKPKKEGAIILVSSAAGIRATVHGEHGRAGLCGRAGRPGSLASEVPARG